MPQTIQFQSRVGKDGVLDIHVPLEAMGADSDVLVTIQKVGGGIEKRPMDRDEWHRFVEATYGSCHGLGVERLPQGNFEKRKAIE